MTRSDLLGSSILYAWASQFRVRIRRAGKSAAGIRLVLGLVTALGQALEHSRLGGLGRTLSRITRGSWLYRWLTSEPDPDVVVIDLRETWTVGPILAIFEWVLRPLERYWPRSGLGAVTSSTTEQFRTAPIRVLGLGVTIAVSVSLILAFVLGNPTSSSLGIQLCVLAIGLLATRIDTSWRRLRDGPIGRALKAVFEPPDPPERP
jgi:hypothetical protein